MTKHITLAIKSILVIAVSALLCLPVLTHTEDQSYETAKGWTVYARANNVLNHKIYQDPAPDTYVIADLSWDLSIGK